MTARGCGWNPASPSRRVPDPKYQIATRYEIGVTLCVVPQMSRIVMLRAVELDDKSRAMTGEIRAIRTNRHLPPEVETSAFKFAYVKPKEKFGVGQFPAQRSRTLQAQRNSPTRTRLHCLRSFGAVRPPRKGEVSFVLDPQVLENR